MSVALNSVFVPQLATLPTDNSTSEWDNLKYLIDHFDSSSEKPVDWILFSKSSFVFLDLLGVEDSISFAIFSLSIVGFSLLTLYTVITKDCVLLIDVEIDSRVSEALLVRCR